MANPLEDLEVIRQVRDGDTGQFEVLIRRYNQRIFRIARSITRDDHEAEDVAQQAFVAAFEHLDQFAGRAKFAAWLTRIAINEAFARNRKKRRFVELAAADRPEPSDHRTPEVESMRHQTREILEAAIEELAEHHRVVLVLRDIEELDTAQTAEVLGVNDQAVRTRLHRARAALREILLEGFGLAGHDVYPFAGSRCDRIVAAVFASIEAAGYAISPRNLRR
jgi:RNA polymerase sigma-70 factor (ECF subfamily)